jgi:NADPH2:quinone reductase
MPHATIISQHGGPEALEYKEFSLPAPAAGEVTIRHTAIGINYIDVYNRVGLYKTPLPFIPGKEAAGVIEAIGEGVEGYKIGDRVCYGTATHLTGSYATHRNMPAQYLLKIPVDIADEVAATIMVKAMTAHYLLRRTFNVMPENRILIHAAAGGVGTYMSQWANALGAIVIGTVSNDAKKKWALDNGCHHVINYQTEDWVARVREITGGVGVPVVYDSVGKDTLLKSIDCLMPLGLLVSFGQSSGAVPPFDISALSKNSCFLTRPSLGEYKKDRNELVMSALEIYENIRSGILRPLITHKIPLKDAAQAHRLLESRQTMGSIVLIP